MEHDDWQMRDTGWKEDTSPKIGRPSDSVMAKRRSKSKAAKKARRRNW